ncbi:MAG TPA: hypothetical protein VLH36_14855 [Steroidobacteraceae bacterium]|jgi:hypothetical protein|nr:hypothetical protein [Steroidobacteraceae bacterium]
MSNSSDAVAAAHGLPVRNGLLPPAVRRDLADLNSQYLELGVVGTLENDPRFGWSEAVRRCLRETDMTTRTRMASSPFALFDLALPATAPGPASRIADAPWVASTGDWQGRCLSFALQAAFLAWRLVESSPYAARVALGLSAADEARLGELKPSQLAELAWSPGLVCARWPRHQRFWEMLVGAAQRDSAGALQWTHCVGLCLFGSDGIAVAPASAEAAARRRTRR